MGKQTIAARCNSVNLIHIQLVSTLTVFKASAKTPTTYNVMYLTT